MSDIFLYDGAYRYAFTIGSVSPGGKYNFSMSLWNEPNGNFPSGTVNGVSIPSVSGQWCDWSWMDNPPTINTRGSDLNAVLGNIVGASGSKNFTTKPNGQGSVITILTDADKNINGIGIQSGSYSYGTSRRVLNDAPLYIYFAWCEGFGFSQYDNLCLAFENDPYGIMFGGGAMLNYVFCENSTSNDLQTRFDSGSLIGASPGDKGFVPTGNKAHIPTGGGDHSGWHPVYPTANIDLPGEPDESVASAIGSGFVNAYKINAANLALLGKALFGGLLEKFANIFVDPLDSIISLQVFPYPPKVGSSEYIKLFNYSCVIDKLGVASSAPVLSNQYRTISFGTLTIDEMWNSFLDYDASSFSLYLPFIGSVDIPVGEVMGGSIKLEYTIDYFTGMCVANVLCTKSILLSDGSTVPQKCYHSYMGNCSVQIPLHKESYASFVGALANAASSGLRAPISLVQSALSGAFKPDIETKGTINANAGFCSVLFPYITITRPITAEPESYQEVMGYPCYVVSTLGDCDDLCVCDNIDLSGLTGATESEMERIKQMCKDGVYV